MQVLSGRQEGRSYLLERGTSSLGLDEKATVGLFGDPSIARKHAEIEYMKGSFVLKNLDPSRLTKINSLPVGSTQELHDGDMIELGGTRLVFRSRG